MKLKDKFYKIKKLFIIKVRGHRITKVGCLSRLVFGLAIILFLLTIIPSFFYRMPFYDYLYKNGKFPYEFSISGNVYNTKEGTVDSEKLNVVAANVYVGGYSTKTDINGEFKLKFMSKDSKDIPVVIIYNDKEYVYQVTYDENDEVYEGFNLNEK